MADREITWSLATQYRNGAYQGTFRFDVLQAALDHMSLYFQVRFRRVTRGGSFLVLQANTQFKNDPNYAAWALGNTIYISPTYNFKRLATWTSKVFLHEFGHLWGGGAHSNDPAALMNSNTGTSYGWVQDDMRWFGKYRLRGALPPRGSIFEAFRGMDGLPPRVGLSAYGGAEEIQNEIPVQLLENIGCSHQSGFLAHFRNYWNGLLARY